MDRRRPRSAVVAASVALALAGAAGCSGKSNADQGGGGGGGAARPAPAAADAAPPAPVNDKPLPGVAVELTGASRDSFFRLVDALPSPCGKAHSLRASIETDPACRRGPHAAKYVHVMLAEGVDAGQIAEKYRLRYSQEPRVIDGKGSAAVGGAAAKVVIHEFFDYGCSHCKEFAPEMAKMKAFYGEQVRVHFMNFPLGHWPDSESCAAAAWAAAQQSPEKFAAMYQELFRSQGDQGPERVLGIAKDVGLDMNKFLADWKSPAAAAQVKAERDRGVAAGVKMTPTVYVNGRMYTDADHLDFTWLKLWIDEELDVNR